MQGYATDWGAQQIWLVSSVIALGILGMCVPGPKRWSVRGAFGLGAFACCLMIVAGWTSVGGESWILVLFGVALLVVEPYWVEVQGFSGVLAWLSVALGLCLPLLGDMMVLPSLGLTRAVLFRAAMLSGFGYLAVLLGRRMFLRPSMAPRSHSELSVS